MWRWRVFGKIDHAKAASRQFFDDLVAAYDGA
jgi:hypothetical protein